MKTWVLMSALICSMVCLTVPAAAIQPFTIVNTDVTYDEVNNLGRYDMTVQVGENPLNRFIAHRIVRVNDWHIPLPAKGPIVLAPSGGSTFEIYGVGGDGESLRDTLALEGYDVYGYTPRPAFLEAGYCDENDCSVMGTWDMEAYVNDAETVALFAGILSGGKRPVIGGFSLGAMIATTAVNDHPFVYAGALLWEGTLVQPDPNAQAAFSGVCDALNQALGGGRGVRRSDQPGHAVHGIPRSRGSGRPKPLRAQLHERDVDELPHHDTVRSARWRSTRIHVPRRRLHRLDVRESESSA